MKHLLRSDDMPPRRGAFAAGFKHFYVALLMSMTGMSALHATTWIQSEGYEASNGFWVLTNDFYTNSYRYSLTRTVTGSTIVTNATINEYEPYREETNSSFTFPTFIGGFPVKTLTGRPIYNFREGEGGRADPNDQRFIINHTPILAPPKGMGGAALPPFITNVTIPKGITQILRVSDFPGAFENLTNVRVVNFPASLTNIGACSFKGSGLRTIKLPLAMTAINAETFANCSSLTSADLGRIATIGPGAFSNCVSLAAVAIPANLRNLGESAFENTALRSVSLPAGVTSIPTAAFKSCTRLTNVVIPSGVTNIGDNAFQGTRLSNVAIPSSVTVIGSNAFQGIPATIVAIPSSVTNIGPGAFAGMGNLTNLVIPESVTSIGDGAFAGAVNLKIVKLPSRFAHMLANLGFGPGVGADALSDSVAQRILSTPGNYGLALKADASSSPSPLNTNNVNRSGGLWSAILSGEENLIETNVKSSAIVGGINNTVLSNATAASVAGGNANELGGNYNAIGGGQANTITNRSSGSVIAGGISNRVTATDLSMPPSFFAPSSGVIGGGLSNTVNGKYATVGGGRRNIADKDDATVGGGDGNLANGFVATVGGGRNNTASAEFCTVPGGVNAKATNAGSFVWSGDGRVDTMSYTNGSFTVRAPGGVRFITSISTNTDELTTPNMGSNGVILLPNATDWASLSDSNSKTDFLPIKPREVLSKLVSLPLTSWHYKHNLNRRYIGPMAQDFHAAFGLGSDDKTISTLDSDGVMYAAIQGLVEELKDRDKTIEQLKSQNKVLSQSIEAINRRLNSLPPSP